MTPLQMTTPTNTTIEIIRSFDAPRPLVWRAHTEPELVKRWLTGPSGHTMPVCEIDLRVGGTYRYVWEWSEGRMVATGTYKEIAPEQRILCTEVFDIFPDNETLVEQVFSEKGGRTIVAMNLHYDSQETRDGVLQSPMDEGLEASYRNLDALVAETV
ncbi:SRPBCC family protein [Denitrobaculum tricleocarpae]|uniref:ATPase n=1 Tax=Denitrobaculum tricleocarpae TaxID=2591009 RepID=A0A545TXL1_9PROT|nr:SRPBCC family protein [Denitrobaculum tricleocarpae]TQV81959.1 ATPase [Denitrobaculum tricleocarpae]